MINLGIIGFGGIAKSYIHMDDILNNPELRIKAAADINPDDSIAKQKGIPDYYTDYKELLKDPEIDAVLIATPHDLHAVQAIDAFNAGKHVLIEKPIARNLKEAKAIIDAAEKSGKVGMIGFCQRFAPVHAEMKKIIKEKQLGNPLSVRIDHYQNFNPAPNSWWRNAERVGGGAVIGSGVHRIDLLRWMFGEIKKVYAVATYVPERTSGEACVHSVIEFESGLKGNFSINWASFKYLYSESVTVSCENGMIYDKNDYLAYKISRRGVDNGILKDAEAEICPTMYEHFVDCIKNNKTPDASLEEGYKTLQVIRAIYKSIELGEPVLVSDVDF